MPNTTNFNWPTPADTDLVKDGAAAIRNLGNGVDTSLIDLKGGTTGQNLRKASNTDLDFTFAGDATNTVIDAEGDLLVGDSADTLQRLAIGSNGNVLTIDTSVDGKIKWAAAASGGFTLINSGGTALSGASTSVSSIPNTYKNLHIYIEDYYPAGAGANGAVRFNNYVSDYSGGRVKQEGSGGSATPTLGGNNAADRIYVVESMAAADNNNFAWFIVPNYASTVARKVLGGNSCYNDGTYTWNVSNFGIWYGPAAAIDSVQIMTSSTWSGGRVYVYGEN